MARIKIGQISTILGVFETFFDDVDLNLDLKINPSECPLKAKLDLKTVTKSSKTVLFSNQPLFVRHQYWVKGVGNIKNITTPSKLVAKLNLVDTQMKESESQKALFTTTSEKAECGGPAELPFKLTIVPKFKAIINAAGYVQIPFTIDTRSYVQNLRKYTIRKTLN